jgi:hypothetical protein
MRIEIPVTESSFRYKLQNRFTSQRNAYSHANGIPIPIRPESLFRSNGMSILIDRNTQTGTVRLKGVRKEQGDRSKRRTSATSAISGLTV